MIGAAFSFFNVILLCLGAWPGFLGQQGAISPAADNATPDMQDVPDDTPTEVLSAHQQQRVNESVERALEWMVTQQQEDGSFLTLERGQPGVTCLCVMAFMAHGHLPGAGPYGERLERATDYVLSCQKQNGLICSVTPDTPQLSRRVGGLGTNTAYNHAISALLLSELYGLGGAPQAARMQQVIQRALAVSLEMQRWPKDNAADKGGWRYVDDRDQSDSDLSVTGWELMLLRSARNAGFDVPKDAIGDAVAYVLRCYSKQYGPFQYWIDRGDGRSRGMAGAGILAQITACASFFDRHKEHEETQRRRTNTTFCDSLRFLWPVWLRPRVALGSQALAYGGLERSTSSSSNRRRNIGSRRATPKHFRLNDRFQRR
jgi:hypothetical protein